MKIQWVVSLVILMAANVAAASESLSQYCHDNQEVYFRPSSSCSQESCWQKVETDPLREVEIISLSSEHRIFRFHLNPLLTQISICTHTPVREPDFAEYERQAYFEEIGIISELLRQNTMYVGMFESRTQPSQSLGEGGFVPLQTPAGLVNGIYNPEHPPLHMLTAGGEFGGGGASADSTSLNRIGISVLESEVEKWKPEPRRQEEEAESEGTDI